MIGAVGAAVLAFDLAGCAGAAPKSIGSAHDRAVGPMNTSNVPVSFRGENIEPDPSEASVTLVG